MSKKRRGRKPHHRGGRVTPKGGSGGPSRPRHFEPDHEPAIDAHPLAHVAQLLREDHPMALLDTASSMAWTIAPQTQGLGEEEPAVDAGELIESLLLHDDPATTALLGGLAVVLDDEPTRRRCAQEVGRRRWSTPPWFQSLGAATVRRVVESTELRRDGENIYIELGWPTGQVMTVVAYIDHNLGGIVKDAFTVPITVEEMRFVMREAEEVPDLTFDDVDAANARARLEEAIDWANRTWPPAETDTWPLSQPLLRWATSLLPPGGEAPEPKERSEDELADLERSFLDSGFAQTLTPADEALVEPILWYGTSYGNGDPYRWGPPRVEILLLDWMPRKVMAPYDELARVPDVLRAFIPWAHGEAGIPDHLTAETLAVVDDYEGDYLAAIADDDRPQGPAALLAAMGLTPEHEGHDEGLETLQRLDDQQREVDVRAVGGQDGYDALDVEPLPDEPPALDRVADDIRERVAAIGALSDRVCEEFFDDIELRTACRRFLLDAAAGDPAVFRRRSKDELLAGAVCWVVAKANGLLGFGDAGPMLATLGLTGSVGGRAKTLLAAAGTAGWTHDDPVLGTPRYLTSGTRQRIIDRREGRWPGLQ